MWGLPGAVLNIAHVGLSTWAMSASKIGDVARRFGRCCATDAARAVENVREGVVNCGGMKRKKEMMRRVAVLGATSGIGRALVVRLREEGYEVVAVGRRRALLETLGGETLTLDVTAPEAVAQVAALGVDTVIYNAGFGERTALPDASRTARALEVNVIAFERFAQWALTACRCFVATASIAGVRGLEDTNGYSASKAYMINAMEGYRRKARHGGFACRYVTLLPGFVDTAMGQASRFWRCSAETAANVIVRGLQRGGEVLYVTPRWRWIALLMRCLPRGIFERIPLK